MKQGASLNRQHILNQCSLIEWTPRLFNLSTPCRVPNLPKNEGNPSHWAFGCLHYLEELGASTMKPLNQVKCVCGSCVGNKWSRSDTSWLSKLDTKLWGCNAWRVYKCILEFLRFPTYSQPHINLRFFLISYASYNCAKRTDFSLGKVIFLWIFSLLSRMIKIRIFTFLLWFSLSFYFDF